MPFLRGFPGVFYMPWLICGLAALTPFWAILGRLGMKKGRRPLPTPMISRLLINCGPFPPQMLPFPAEIAGFPDVSRLIPVYPAFLKYIVPVHPPPIPPVGVETAPA